MLEFKRVNKRFPGVHALKDIDLEIRKGEIVGLVGENGAGKSTLMKVLYGAYQHDDGQVLIDGQECRFANPRQAMDFGLGMVFQEQSLIPNLSVMENIFLGFEQPFLRFGVMRWKRMAEAARQQLAKVRLDVDPATITAELSFAQRQLVELAKVLTLEERVQGDLVILLDEPTSVLSAEEVQLLFELVRGLRTRASFIFVSHRLDEVMTISDRIYVMKDGAVVAGMTQAEATVEAIQHKMVGRAISSAYYREDRQQRPREDVLLHMQGLSRRGAYDDISLTLRRGEVLALVGTEGSGGEAIMRTIFGLDRPEAGLLQIKGEDASGADTARAVARGVGYIPRERKIEGVVGGMSVSENITLSQLGSYSRASVIDKAAEKRLAREWIDKLEIKTPSERANVGKLSGGNQQKVVLSKWRSAGADIILLDHPTRGVDIGAKEHIYAMVRDMCEQGCGVLLMGDTFEEAIGLAHTIAVLKDGRVTKVFDCPPGAKPEPLDLIQHMT